MKIAFNPSTVAALITPPNNKDITFDLRGQNIFARGVKFCGTDTWRDIKINNVSIGSNILDLRNGSNTTLTNTNGVVTINSTWRPVVDNLTSDSTTSSLSAKQGKILKSLIDGKSDSGHNHDDRYLKLTGGTMASNALITFADSGSWGTDKGPQGARGGLYWTGQSDYAKLYAEETREDNLDLVIQFGDDNSNGLSIRNKDNTQTSYISSSGVITTGTFKGNLDWSYITNKPATATRWPSWAEVTGKPSSFTPSTHTHGLSNSVFFLNMPSISGNAKWKEVFGYPVNYNLLLSVRINSPAPEWCVGNYGSGILYGGSDTKGFMSSAYNEPLIMWAGGNGSSDDSVPKWYIGIKGIHKSIYNLATIASEANAAYNLRHSHANKSVLDGITSALVNNWNTAYTFVNTITGTDTDKVINKWDEIVNFLAGITEDNKLNTLLNSKLSVYELANNTNIGTIKNNGIYYSTSDASSGTLTNSPFNTGFTLINMTSLDNGDDLRRSRLAFNAYGEIKVSDDRDLANTAETWYNVLTSKNSGISGSTIKLNGTSITVYSSSTADGRYVKKSGDTMSGVLTIDTTNFGALTIKRNDDANGASIQFRGKSSVYGYIGLNNSTKDKQFLRWSSDTSKTYTILDTSSTYVSSGKGIINGTTITQVDNATNSTNSTNARKLVNWYSTRPTSLNTQFGDGSLRIFHATSSTTEGKCPSDASILHLAWDNNGGWDTLLALAPGENKMYFRGQHSGTWQPWKTLAFTTDIPSSLKNPYSLTTFGVVYDGSAAKVVDPSNFISLVNEATSIVTDGTMFITSWASDNGFADTSAVNIPYKRKAIHLWEYVRAKTDSLYATKSHNHDDRYLKLTGGTMTGTINRRSGGPTISGRDHAIIRLTYAPGGSSWNPIACVDTETGTWTLGHLSSGSSDTNFHFCFSTNADYNAGNNNGNYVTLRNKVGTIALLSDIPSSLKNPHALTISLNGTSLGPYDGSAAKNINITPSSIGAATSDHNHDGRYVYNYGGTKMDGASINKNALGMTTNSGITGDWWHILQAAWNGEYRWNSLIAFPTLNRNGMYYRSGLDDNTKWGSWVKLLDVNNYSSTLDSRYYTESEVNNLLDAKLNRQNLSYGTWNPRGYNLAADYLYNGGDLSISESGGKIHVSVDGYFWLNEGQYRVLDTSDISSIRGGLTLYQHLSATDANWWPLVWGGSDHKNTNNSTGSLYKSYDKLCWQTSSLTLYATNIQTSNIKNLSVGGGIYWNPYVESTTDGSDAASITLVKSGVAGGTTLVLSLMNDANDTILFKTNTAARLYHNSYPILTTLNTYVSNNKGYINNTEITLVNNADKVDNRHAISTTPNTGIIYKAAIYIISSLTSYWVRLASIPSISLNGEFIATIHVLSGHSNPGRSAILLVYLRGSASSFMSKSFKICCNSNYDPNRFRLYYKDSDKTSEIWYQTTGLWDGIITTVISLSSEGSLYEGLTLYSGNITAVQTPSMSTYLSALVSTITDNISGNASTATKLLNARLINGTNFDGTSNITTSYWGATRTLTIGNSGKSVNGSANISWSLSEIGAASSSHSHNYAANENYGGFTKSGRLPISGFYQSAESESGGNAPWSGWMHLINCLHSNTGNNYALLIAASFSNNNTFKIRVTNNNVNNAWRDIIHSGNIGSQTVTNAYHLRINSANTWSTWNWSGLSGQPSWLWGSNDGTNMYVWNPSNFRVAYASSAGNADTVDGYHSSSFLTKHTREGAYNIDHLTDFVTRDLQPKSEINIEGTKPYDGWGMVAVLKTDNGTAQLVFDGSSNMYFRSSYGSEHRYVTSAWKQVAALSSNVASATKLQTARKIWGQSFDGTADISGTLSGVAHILFSADNTYNIGSNSAASKYIYTYWLGAKSGLKLELGANNSNFGLGLCIDTNLNVGIGTNTPAYKLHVAGDIYTTTGFKKNGSSDSYVLLGGGGHKLISDFATNNHTHSDYVTLTTTLTIEGSKTFTTGIKFNVNNNGDANLGSGDGFKLFYNETSGRNFPGNYYNVASFITGYTGFLLACYGGADLALKYRHREDNGTWQPWKTLAFTTDIPSSLKNPYALTLKANGTTLATYDGSSAKEANFTYANVGAASASHTHSYITISTCSTLNENSNNFSVEYAGGSNSVITKPSGVDAFSVMKLRTASGWYGLILMSNSKGIYYRSANGLTSSVNWIKLLDSSNSNVSGGGNTWGSSITVNINGTSKTLTIPNNPNTDYRVTQSETTTANYRPLVVGYTNVSTAGSGMTGSVTNQVYLSNKFYVQPSTGNLYATNFVGALSGNATTATNSDTLDGYHANGLLTALSNSDKGISITVGGTTKSITNISVNYANSAGSAGSATKVIVNLHTANDTNYPLVWSNLANSSTITENQLYKSWSDLYYNPKNKRLTVGGSVVASSFVKRGGTSLQLLRADGGIATFNWSGQSGLPNWLWGGNNEHSYYVYNPSNFRVAYATSAGSADTLDGVHLSGIFTAFGNNAHNITATIGGVTKSFLVNWAADSDKLDGYHASNLLTSVTNTNNGISVTVGGTTKSVSNISVNYANSAGSADTALYLRSLGNLNCQTGRTLNYGDVYSYNTYDGNTGSPTSYTSVIGFGRGIAGTVEIAGGWDNTNLYWRSLRDCCEDWHSWRTVLDSSNYTEFINNYYWANVKISTTSSTTTSPTVSNLTATSSIRMGNIYLLNTNEINSASGIHLNYQNSGNVSLCVGGGNVGIGAISPSYKLNVNGNIHSSGTITCNALNVDSTLSIKDSVISCSAGNISILSKESGSLLINSSEVLHYDSDFIHMNNRTNFLHGLCLKSSILDTTYSIYTTDDVTVLIDVLRDSSSFKFKPAKDGLLLFLKIGKLYSNTYFWCTAENCVVVRAKDFGIYLDENQNKDCFGDGLARIFIYIEASNRWYEFYCG